MTVTPATSRAVAEAAERLAAPSSVVASALRLLDDGGVPLRRVAECVGESPELAAQVLRMASSALNGRPASSLEQAVVRIGSDGLRGVLLAAQTYSLMAGSLELYGLPRMSLVARAADIARSSQEVARAIVPDEAPAAHLAGLLANIGMPILSSVGAPPGAAPIPGSHSFVEERGIFGVDHMQVGAGIARRWGIGDRLAVAIAQHHDPSPPDDDVARAVWLGTLVVGARSGDPDSAERLSPALERCGLSDAMGAALVVGGGLEPGPVRPPGLTDREVEVLRAVAAGAAPKQVALELGCAPSTVHNHLHHVYRKLDVTGQAQALLLARDRGWV